MLSAYKANEGATGKIRIYPRMKYYIHYGYPVVLVIVFVCLVQMYSVLFR